MDENKNNKSKEQDSEKQLTNIMNTLYNHIY